MIIEHNIRRFVLKRDEDVNGNSGIGIIAEGCEMSNGLVFLTWRSEHRSGTFYESLHTLKHLHGHKGKTHLVWIDPPTPDDIELEQEEIK